MTFYYRSSQIWSQIYFLILSVAMVYILHCIGLSVSVFSSLRLKVFLLDNVTLILLTMALSVLIYSYIKAWRWLFYLHQIFISTLILAELFDHFSKINILLYSSYCCISYFVYQLTQKEMSLACFNKTIDKQRVVKKISVSLQEHDTIIGQMLDWDEQSCLVEIEEFEKPKKQKVIVLKVHVDDLSFEGQGQLVSSKQNRYWGINFEKNLNSWNDFFIQLERRGYKMELLQ